MENCKCTNGCNSKANLVIKGKDILHGYSGEFEVVQCEKCGLSRTNPRPPESEIGSYYPHDYIPYRINIESRNENKNYIKKYIFNILNLENRKLPDIKKGYMLEIGCSTGEYMQKARDLGWQCDGIEFSSNIANICREKGFNVQSCTVDMASKPNYKYDLIVAWMVIEHLYDPVASLIKIRSWSSENCILIGSVPDFGSLERKIFGKYWYALQLPTHLYHFNKKTLQVTLENAGWTLTNIRWQRDCKNLLWSIELFATQNNYLRLKYFIQNVRSNKKFIFLRILLSALLGSIRQSGRLEFEARRNHNYDK